jgi:hypothetical protein
LYEVIGEPPSFFGGDQFKVTSSPKTLLNLIGPVGFAGTATTRNQHAEFDGHIFTFINLSKITYKVIWANSSVSTTPVLLPIFPNIMVSCRKSSPLVKIIIKLLSQSQSPKISLPLFTSLQTVYFLSSGTTSMYKIVYRFSFWKKPRM